MKDTPREIIWTGWLFIALAVSHIILGAILFVYRDFVADALAQGTLCSAANTYAHLHVCIRGSIAGGIISHSNIAFFYIALLWLLSRRALWAQGALTVILLISLCANVFLHFPGSYAALFPITLHGYEVFDQVVAILLKITALLFLWYPKTVQKYFRGRA